MNASPYDFPRLYDIAYGWRDFRAECNFMVEQATVIAGKRPESALEIACGPGNHARMLAAMGIKCTGLDSSAAMLAYARNAAGGNDPDVSWLKGDMRDFRLAGQVEMAFCLMDSLSHLLTLDDLLVHFGAVAGNLTAGGVYIIDQSHPRDVFGHEEPGTPAEWSSEDEDGDIIVETVWGTDEDEFDATTQVGRLTVSMSAYRGDERVQAVQMVPSRLWLAGEMEAAIRLSGLWRVAARFGALDATVKWQNEPPASRMVWLLQRLDKGQTGTNSSSAS